MGMVEAYKGCSLDHLFNEDQHDVTIFYSLQETFRSNKILVQFSLLKKEKLKKIKRKKTKNVKNTSLE